MSKKISQLDEITTVLNDDLLPVVNGGETKKVTKENLLKEIQPAEFIDGESLTGTINGANTVFTTQDPFTPLSTRIYLNGLRLSSTEYAETGVTEITLTDPPESGDTLLIDYRK